MSERELPAFWTIWCVPRGVRAVGTQQFRWERQARAIFSARREAMQKDEEIAAMGLSPPGAEIVPCAGVGGDDEPVTEEDLKRIQAIMERHGLWQSNGG